MFQFEVSRFDLVEPLDATGGTFRFHKPQTPVEENWSTSVFLKPNYPPDLGGQNFGVGG